MSAIVTNVVRESGGSCNHLAITVDFDGVSKTFKTGSHDGLYNTALTDDELTVMFRYLARWWRGKGLDLADFIGRVLCGEEGTNVKLYSFFGPGAAIAKTNIGTSYVNICPGLNGERIAVDFTGCTQFRFFLSANLIGTGAFAARAIRDSDSTVLIENTNLGAAGERDIDSDWQNLPAAFLGQGLTLMRIQAKSATGADDPVFRRCCMGLK